MNYEGPRQVDPAADRPDAGKWRWTTSNRRSGTYPTGACSEWETCEKCGGLSGILRPDVQCDCGNGARRKAEPCPGHDTEQGAIEHQHEYLIAHARFRTMDNPNALYKCQAAGCGTFTAGVLEIEGDGYFMKTVCPEHQTPEIARQLIPPISSSMHS